MSSHLKILLLLLIIIIIIITIICFEWDCRVKILSYFIIPTLNCAGNNKKAVIQNTLTSPTRDLGNIGYIHMIVRLWALTFSTFKMANQLCSHVLRLPRVNCTLLIESVRGARIPPNLSILHLFILKSI